MAVNINGNYTNSEYSSSSLRNSMTSNGTKGESTSRVTGGVNAKNLSAGSTLSGEVVSKDGNTVTLKLSNNQTISAKLDGNADVSVGQKLTFEVAKSAQNQTLLRPLYSNLAANSAVSTALKEAILPVNERNVAFTSQMMKEGMPINKNALLDMARSVASFPEADLTTIVQMKKIGLEINDTNITQFDNYKNFTHQIVNDSSIVGDGLANIIADTIEANLGDFESIIDVTNEILNLVDTEATEILLPSNDSLISSAGGLELTADEDVSDLLDVGITDDTNSQDANNRVDTKVIESANSDNFNVNNNISLNAKEQQVLINDINNALELVGNDNRISSPIDVRDALAIVRDLVNNHLGQEEVEDIPQYVDTITETEDESTKIETEQNVSNQKIDNSNIGNADTNPVNANKASDAFGMIRNLGQRIFKNTNDQLIEQEPLTHEEKVNNSITNLLKSTGFKKLLSDGIKAQFAINPKDIAKEGKIEELYDRILKTSSKVTQLMEQMGKADSEIAKSASNIADNVNFMDELNQYVSYVQLPLKMAGEDAHGELYVYSRNKKLSDNDGNFSAYLHLDMDHLGPMDVYVTLKDYTKVNTQFYLQDEALLDFLGEHIDELTARLVEKGYNASANISYKSPNEPIKPITEEFVKDDKGTVSKVVTKVCFDVRA